MCSIPIWTYEELSDEEIVDYWNTLTLDQRIQEIRKLDLLEHNVPVFDSFKYLAILTNDNELVIYPEHNIIEARHVYLTYEIELPTFHIKDFKIPAKKKYILTGITGGIIGITSMLIAEEKEWWKYLAGLLTGSSIGITTEYLFR